MGTIGGYGRGETRKSKGIGKKSRWEECDG